MLSINIKNLSLKSKVYDIHNSIAKIQCDSAIEIVKKLIFTKTNYHNVKCISYDVCWCIKTPFIPVTHAIVKVSSIIFALQRYVKQIKNSAIKSQVESCLKSIYDIYHFLKEGLREYGCNNPPFIVGSILKENDIIEAAILINVEWLKH